MRWRASCLSACFPSSIISCHEEGRFSRREAGPGPLTKALLGAATVAATIADDAIVAAAAVLEAVGHTIPVIGAVGAPRTTESPGRSALPAIISRIASAAADAALGAHRIAKIVFARSITDVALLSAWSVGEADA
jgi:hypothetical protein